MVYKANRTKDIATATGVLLALLWSLSGCLPSSEGTSLDVCGREASMSEPCACEGGTQGMLRCVGAQIFCVCDGDKLQDDMSSVLDMSEDMAGIRDAGGDLGSLDAGSEDQADMGGQGEDAAADMEQECAGAACTCETGALPQGWTAGEVGTASSLGVAGSLDGTWCIGGAGEDIFGEADSFRFVSTAVSGDMDLVARVEVFGGQDPWSKVGVMVREDESAGARYAAALVTADQGKMFFYRTMEDGETDQTAWTDGEAFEPVWLKVERRGSRLTGSTSSDGSSWEELGEVTIEGFAQSARAGIALSSHDNAEAVDARLSDVEVIAR